MKSGIIENKLTIKERIRTGVAGYLEKRGGIQDYIEFISCEIDPLFSRQRTAVDVVKIKSETKNTKTFTLKPYRAWGGFKPGQYISVEVEVNGVRLRRNYSISSSQDFFKATGCINITVKQVDGGRVSGYLNNRANTRDVLHIGEAMGSFTASDYLSAKAGLGFSSENEALPPILFIGAGSGITPIMSIVEGIKEHNPLLEFSLVYHVLSKDEVVFADRLKMLAGSLPNFTFLPHYTDEEGFISEKQLITDCPGIVERNIFLCGPPGFMGAVLKCADALSVPRTQIILENFGASNPVNKGDIKGAKAGVVHFSQSDKKVASQGDKTLLELAELMGLNPKYGCRNGICFECKCERGAGQVLNRLTGELIPEEQRQIQTCISIPVGDVSITDL